MAAWIRLQPRSVFGRKLTCSTNLALNGLEFRYERGLLTASHAGTVVVESDGRDFVRVGGLLLKNKHHRGIGDRLEADAYAVTLGPFIAEPSGFDVRQLSSDRNAEESYVVRRRHGWKTRCEIVSAGAVADPDLMMGCLVFCWVEADKDRQWT